MLQTNTEPESVRVLHSFPHKVGAGRICDTAWHEAASAAMAGADVRLLTGAVQRPLPESVRVKTTLARGRFRIPYRALGRMRALALHDRIVARSLPSLAGEVDVVHTWPLGALETLRTAKALGIPTVLERPNAHTRFAYEVVQEECERLGVELPPDHEHAYNDAVLEREEAEYELADRLLCPSEFVAKSFRDRGFPEAKLSRHQYGYDDAVFHPDPRAHRDGAGLTLLFVGVCAVRKGVHFALEAWRSSPASETGRFLIAGEFLPAYERKLADLLSQPSVHVLGHRTDVPELMRMSDAFVLPSVEEGFPLACVEAIGSGCVPLVSDACSEACEHGRTGLVHRVGEVGALSSQITSLAQDPSRLEQLREASIAAAPDFTWARAGERLVDCYREAAAGPARAERVPEPVEVAL